MDSVDWLQASQLVTFSFMDPLGDIKGRLTPLCFFARPRREAVSRLAVGISDYIAVEAIDGLTLVLSSTKGRSVKADGVMRTARVLLVGAVQYGSGAPPTPVDQALV